MTSTATTPVHLLNPPVRRDDRGRVLGDDNLPLTGLCSAQECSTISGLGLSTIYDLMNRGELQSKRFGRARRIPWSAVRELIGAE